MPETGLSCDEIISMRNSHISLHFIRNPIKIVRSQGQYMYNERNEKFIDCTSRTSAVGHCHPEVVAAACLQISQLGVLADGTPENYSVELLATLPSKFEACLFTNSGGEANDLALQLARRYTGRSDVVVVDGAFHGAVLSLADISPKAFRASPEGKKPWVHVIPYPDLYRDDHEDVEVSTVKYTQQVIKVLEDIKQQGHEIGCFMCEPLMVVPGCIVPPQGWLQDIYRYVQDNGGLVISDEIVTGLGRTGSHFWAFQKFADDAVPDIVTAGKCLGNGHPTAAVFTTNKIAQVLSSEERNIHFRCGPVETAVGLAVLRVLEEEKLMSNVSGVGNYFRSKMEELKRTQCHVGDVRGTGLIIGVEIVQGDKLPAPDIAEQLSYRLKDKKVLVAAEGETENVLTFAPPYCLTRDDVDYIAQVFEESLVEVTEDQDIYSFLGEVGEDEETLPRAPWVRNAASTPSSNSTTYLDYEALD